MACELNETELKQFFDEIDKDGDGIEASEIEAILKKVGASEDFTKKVVDVSNLKYTEYSTSFLLSNDRRKKFCKFYTQKVIERQTTKDQKINPSSGIS